MVLKLSYAIMNRLRVIMKTIKYLNVATRHANKTIIVLPLVSTCMLVLVINFSAYKSIGDNICDNSC